MIDQLFSSVALQAYLMEIRELSDRVLFRLGQLEEISVRCLAAHTASDGMPSGRLESIEIPAREDLLRRQLIVQGELFDQLEAMLAAWARLSLLLKPAARGKGKVFAEQRGELLRDLMGIETGSVLLDRELRNAWMHFDERLDYIIRKKDRWGNRHRFSLSSECKRDNGTSIRLVSLDTLEVTYPDDCGVFKTTSLRGLRTPLLEIPERCQRATAEYSTRFPPIGVEGS